MSDLLRKVGRSGSDTTRPVWVPPAVSVGSLFGLFLVAAGLRRSPIAEATRGVMIAISTVVSVAIALYGIKMLIEARARGIASAVAGLVMTGLGISTIIHVLK